MEVAGREGEAPFRLRVLSGYRQFPSVRYQNERQETDATVINSHLGPLRPAGVPREVERDARKCKHRKTKAWLQCPAFLSLRAFPHPQFTSAARHNQQDDLQISTPQVEHFCGQGVQGIAVSAAQTETHGSCILVSPIGAGVQDSSGRVADPVLQVFG